SCRYPKDCSTCSSVTDEACSAKPPALPFSLRPQHPVQIGVAEPALRVKPIANRGETVPEWVAQSQRVCRLEVQLAPVWPSFEGVHDRLDLSEERFVRSTPVHVNSDVARLAARRRAERDVVGGYRSHLDGEADAQTRSVDHGAHLSYRLEQVGARNR